MLLVDRHTADASLVHVEAVAADDSQPLSEGRNGGPGVHNQARVTLATALQKGIGEGGRRTGVAARETLLVMVFRAGGPGQRWIR